MERLLTNIWKNSFKMPYLLDSNILIIVARILNINLFPSFWNKMYELVLSRSVFICSKVKDEIDKGNDDLTAWINKLPDSSIIEIDEDIMNKYSDIINWSQTKKYTTVAKNQFAQSKIADAFIVATALSKNLTITTEEKPGGNTINNIKIPDVAKAFGVRCCNLSQMLTELDIKI